MESGPGIFSSSSATDDWRLDDYRPGEVHVLIDEPGIQVGSGGRRLVSLEDTMQWAPPGRELISVLRGRGHLQIEGGPELDLRVGGVAALPAGAQITWRVSPDFLEFWLLVPSPQ